MKNIKQLILKDFCKKGTLRTPEIEAKFRMSRQGIHRYLSLLVKEGHILKQGTSRRTSYYILNKPSALKKVWKKNRSFKKRVRATGLHEDILLKEVEEQTGLLNDLSSQAMTNFAYGFTEMVNNAIDHSGTKLITVEVDCNLGMNSFSVVDTGVGVFQNICEKKNLSNEMEAIQDLLKGKQTTMPEKHSGEGIFFTSKIADRFIIESHRKQLIIDNILNNDIFIKDIRYRKGTRVFFEQRAQTKKKLDDLFRQYTNEEFQFSKSHVSIKLFTSGDLYVARSQAKRLLHSLEKFEEIILDFKGVPTVGQGFADEIFRVFKKDHPDIKITAINCNENIDFMIKRAKAETSDKML
jgi:anti-sigma regulatory factor (Ser/Thr protein kinase)